MCWNREFQDLFDLPPDLARVGRRASTRSCASTPRAAATGRASRTSSSPPGWRASSTTPSPCACACTTAGNVIEIRSAHMPDGGIVTTYTDITAAVEAEEALERANETLERRVRERTEELMRLNEELGRAKAAGRRRQRLEDALPRRRQPRHPAAAQRRAPLRHLAGGAHARRRRRRAGRERRRLAGGRRGDPDAPCSTSRGSIPGR